jgi:hypothetical protein
MSRSIVAFCGGALLLAPLSRVALEVSRRRFRPQAVGAVLRASVDLCVLALLAFDAALMPNDSDLGSVALGLKTADVVVLSLPLLVIKRPTLLEMCGTRAILTLIHLSSLVRGVTDASSLTLHLLITIGSAGAAAQALGS